MDDLTENEWVVLLHLNNNRSKANTLDNLPDFLKMPKFDFNEAISGLNKRRYIYREGDVFKISEDGEKKVNIVKASKDAAALGGDFNAAQYRLINLQIDDLQKKPRQRWNDFWRTLIGIALGALLGGLSSRYLQKDPSTTVVNQVPAQKIQIVYDTIRVDAQKSLDTTPVRLVKLPGHFHKQGTANPAENVKKAPEKRDTLTH